MSHDLSPGAAKGKASENVIVQREAAPDGDVLKDPSCLEKGPSSVCTEEVPPPMIIKALEDSPRVADARATSDNQHKTTHKVISNTTNVPIRPQTSSPMQTEADTSVHTGERHSKPLKDSRLSGHTHMPTHDPKVLSIPKPTNMPTHNPKDMSLPVVTNLQTHHQGDISIPELTNMPTHNPEDMLLPEFTNMPIHNLRDISLPELTNMPTQKSDTFVQDLFQRVDTPSAGDKSSANDTATPEATGTDSILENGANQPECNSPPHPGAAKNVTSPKSQIGLPQTTTMRTPAVDTDTTVNKAPANAQNGYQFDAQPCASEDTKNLIRSSTDSGILKGGGARIISHLPTHQRPSTTSLKSKCASSGHTVHPVGSAKDQNFIQKATNSSRTIFNRVHRDEEPDGHTQSVDNHVHNRNENPQTPDKCGPLPPPNRLAKPFTPNSTTSIPHTQQDTRHSAQPAVSADSAISTCTSTAVSTPTDSAAGTCIDSSVVSQSYPATPQRRDSNEHSSGGDPVNTRVKPSVISGSHGLKRTAPKSKPSDHPAHSRIRLATADGNSTSSATADTSAQETHQQSSFGYTHVDHPGSSADQQPTKHSRTQMSSDETTATAHASAMGQQSVAETQKTERTHTHQPSQQSSGNNSVTNQSMHETQPTNTEVIVDEVRLEALLKSSASDTTPPETQPHGAYSNGNGNTESVGDRGDVEMRASTPIEKRADDAQATTADVIDSDVEVIEVHKRISIDLSHTTPSDDEDRGSNKRKSLHSRRKSIQPIETGGTYSQSRIPKGKEPMAQHHQQPKQPQQQGERSAYEQLRYQQQQQQQRQPTRQQEQQQALRPDRVQQQMRRKQIHAQRRLPEGFDGNGYGEYSVRDRYTRNYAFQYVVERNVHGPSEHSTVMGQILYRTPEGEEETVGEMVGYKLPITEGTSTPRLHSDTNNIADDLHEMIVYCCERDGTPRPYRLDDYDFESVYTNKDILYIRNVVVTETHRGKGLGMRMLRGLLQWLRDDWSIVLTEVAQKDDDEPEYSSVVKRKIIQQFMRIGFLQCKPRLGFLYLVPAHLPTAEECREMLLPKKAVSVKGMRFGFVSKETHTIEGYVNEAIVNFIDNGPELRVNKCASDFNAFRLVFAELLGTEGLVELTTYDAEYVQECGRKAIKRAVRKCSKKNIDHRAKFLHRAISRWCDDKENLGEVCANASLKDIVLGGVINVMLTHLTAMNRPFALQVEVPNRMDINEQDAHGYTPLHAAAFANLPKGSVEVLLACGADKTIVNAQGFRPVDEMWHKIEDLRDTEYVMLQDTLPYSNAEEKEIMEKQQTNRYALLLLMLPDEQQNQLYDGVISPRMRFKLLKAVDEALVENMDLTSEAPSVYTFANLMFFKRDHYKLLPADQVEWERIQYTRIPEHMLEGWKQVLNAVELCLKRDAYQTPTVERVRSIMYKRFSRNVTEQFYAGGGTVEQVLCALLSANFTYHYTTYARSLTGEERDRYEALPQIHVLDWNFDLLRHRLLGTLKRDIVFKWKLGDG